MIPKHIKDSWLKPAEQKHYEEVFAMYGAWEFSGLDRDKRVNMIYKLMRSVEAVNKVEDRLMCDDVLGALLNEIYTVRTKNAKGDTILMRDFFKQKYWFGRTERQIAIYMQKRDDEKRCLVRWQEIVRQHLREIERFMARELERIIQNHKNTKVLRKYLYCA